jgi:Zn-dependent protease with chaperone function
MRRRPDRALLSLLAPLLLFIAFGAARVDAPVSLIGLLFDRAWVFALAALALAILGAALLFIRPVERRVAGVIAPAREPTEEEAALLRRLLAGLGRRSGTGTGSLQLLVHETGELNAAAGAARLLFVTNGALRLPEPQLEALLAHELGHHRGLHPVATTLVWWLALPGEALAKVYSLLRALARRLTGSVRLLALLVQVVIVAWQLVVMWIYYAGKLLMQWAARSAEFVADRAAVDWGYGPALLGLYRAMGDDEPPTRLGRLLADHPPMPERIARIEQALGEAVGQNPGGEGAASAAHPPDQAAGRAAEV